MPFGRLHDLKIVDIPMQNDEPEKEVNDSIANIEQYLPVDDVVEEVAVDGQTQRRKGVYLLPNLFTTAALFSGFYAIVVSMQGRLELATTAIIIAMAMDILDGRVARITNTQSAFGAEYDSLSDMVSFGVAPALVMFNWALYGMGKFGWAASFIFIACAALRLARFNTSADAEDKRYFKGLASPAAAATVACTVWLCSELGLVADNIPRWLQIVAMVETAVLGFLMVSNVRYHSFKGLALRGRVPLAALILAVVIFAIIIIEPASVLLSMLAIYIASGVLLTIFTNDSPKS